MPLVNSSDAQDVKNAHVTSRKKQGKRLRLLSKHGRKERIELAIIQLEMRIDGLGQHLRQTKEPDYPWIMKEAFEMIGLMRSIRENYRILIGGKQWTFSTGSGKYNTKPWEYTINRRRGQAP